jgi:murein DD-endopeptidase MepM/ murein hydrolase activator NlpD
VPTPPRSRYAAVVTTAFVGAGIVAIGTSAALPDLKNQAQYATGTVIDGSDLADRENAAAAADRASRGNDRKNVITTLDQKAADFWQLPLRSYRVTSLFGQRWGRLHAGCDLAAPEGQEYYAAAAGTVVVARWNGGYGYNIQIDHGNGIMSVYGHSSRLLVKEGQHVESGQLIGKVGNTGHSFGSHLHFEIRVNDVPNEPFAFMRKHGVDIPNHVEVINGGSVLD